jgi:hypothetical protein
LNHEKHAAQLAHFKADYAALLDKICVKGDKYSYDEAMKLAALTTVIEALECCECMTQSTPITQSAPVAEYTSKSDTAIHEIHAATCYYEQYAATRKPYYKTWCGQSLDHAVTLIGEKKQTSLDPATLNQIREWERQIAHLREINK